MKFNEFKTTLYKTKLIEYFFIGMFTINSSGAYVEFLTLKRYKQIM